MATRSAEQYESGTTATPPVQGGEQHELPDRPEQLSRSKAERMQRLRRKAQVV
ncbi:hypothetical protein KEM52_001612, partial [Ascosphaera acerosa]